MQVRSPTDKRRPPQLAKRALQLRIAARSFLSGQKLRVLISSSKPAWQPPIEAGFRRTRHEITFGRVHPSDLAKYDRVVPLTIEDLVRLNDGTPMLGNPLPVPSLDCIRLCDDKYALNRFLEANGFGGLVPRMGRSAQFPYIVKKRSDEWGQNSHLVTDSEKESELSGLIEHPEYFPQEFILGETEHAAHLLFRSGEVVRSLTVDFTFSSVASIKGKDRPRYKTVGRSRYLDVFATILQDIGFEGVCCINYKTRDGAPMLLEINPRVGGSLCPFLPYFVEA